MLELQPAYKALIGLTDGNSRNISLVIVFGFGANLKGMRLLSFVFLYFFLGCVTAPSPPSSYEGKELKIDKLLMTPSPQGHQDFIEGISSAQNSVHLKMYHLTDAEVIDALRRANKRGIEVRIIVDRKSLKIEKFRKFFTQLEKEGLSIRASSPAFTITHEKSMIVDGQIAFITAINLTRNARETRDFGVITHDEKVVSEMEDVFSVDWENALNRTGLTPKLNVQELLWSPINSREKLVSLIGSSRVSLIAQVENLGDLEIQKAFRDAVHRGVKVRLIVPMCDKNPNPLYNYPFLEELENEGVLVRVMPFPSSPEMPYMHSKMILADGNVAYVGSVNFSNNSTQKARELGIIFQDTKSAQIIKSEFEKDWQVSVAPKKPASGFCPVGE